jgi:hypothetical protein
MCFKLKAGKRPGFSYAKKIFSVDHIPKVRINLNKLVTLISLAFGAACMQIILSPIVAHADRPRSEIEAENIQGAYLTLIFSFFVLVVVFIFAIWKQQANDSTIRRKEEQTMDYYASLSLEEKQKFINEEMREIERLERLGREDGQMAEQYKQRDQYKEHQEFLGKMEKERIERENKIRDFRNRYGREPNSWEI